MTVVRSSHPSYLVLPSGRTVVESRSDKDEAIEVVSPTGDVELSIRFTADGPVLSFRSASLELKSTRDISVECETFDVRAKRAASLSGGEIDITSTEGELRLTGASDAWVTAPMLLLNCDRETEMAERELVSKRTRSPCGCTSDDSSETRS